MQSRPIYRMPVHFGPALGPRNIPAHVNIDHRRYPTVTTATITARGNRDQLESLLAPGFALDGPPRIHFAFMILKEIQWLGGRGYNIFMVATPAVFQGRKDTVSGNFVFVMFESLADPIITGRGELGANKVYANVREPVTKGDSMLCAADWDGFEFVEARFTNLQDKPAPTAEEWAARPELPGVLNYKYIPKTGVWGEADVAYATYWPNRKDLITIESIQEADGVISFHRGSWEQLPTLQNIVGGLADLEIGGIEHSRITRGRGQGDVGDVRILE